MKTCPNCRIFNIALLLLVFVLSGNYSSAQIISTIAGNGSAGFGGDGGPATAASLNSNWGMILDTFGNIYVSDFSNSRVRKINAAGIISTYAGNGSFGFSGDGGAATAASLNGPTGLALDGAGNLYIADVYNNRVRKVTTSGIITTVAGGGSSMANGIPATNSALHGPNGLAVDFAGNILIPDQGYQLVRKVNTSGIINTVAGNGSSGFSGDGGPATNASLNLANDVSVDGAGNLYISDWSNNRIRIVNTSGIINTFAGNGTAGYSGDGGPAISAAFLGPMGVDFDRCNSVIICDVDNHRVRRVTSSGIVNTIAGLGTAGFSGDGGPATAAQFNRPVRALVDTAGNIYLSDRNNNRIRKVTPVPYTIPDTITGPNVVCPGSHIILVDTVSGGVWATTDATIASVNGAGYVTGIAPGTVVISYSVWKCGATATDTQTVTVLPFPTIIVPDAGVCTGGSTTLTATGASTYTWSPAVGLSATTGSAVVATPTVTTVYSVRGTDIYGCFSDTTFTVFVNPIPAAPNVTSPVNYCLGATAAPLTASGTSLLWYSAATGGSGSVTPPVPSTAAVGVFHYYVTQSVYSCESPRADITVNVLNNGIADFEYKIHYGCAFDSVEFLNKSQYCDRYEWSFGDGSPLDSATNPTHLYQPVNATTTYTVKLRGISDVCGDGLSVQMLTLTPNPNPPAVITSITPGQSIPFGSSIQLEVKGGYIFSWKPDDGSLDNPNVSNPVATPSVTTTYVVYAYDRSGCRDSARVEIDVDYNDIDNIPTAFTPNGDGQNDVFRVLHLKYGKLLEFSIYNRWGERVFYTTDITKGWDGTYNNELQDMGVYNYLVVVSHTRGENETYKGTVTLIR